MIKIWRKRKLYLRDLEGEVKFREQSRREAILNHKLNMVILLAEVGVIKKGMEMIFLMIELVYFLKFKIIFF